MSIDKKSLLLTVICYIIWGTAPLYWALISRYDSLFNLANRIVWGAVFLLLWLACVGKLPLLRQTLRSRDAMKYLVPAALFACINWGTYIWAMSNNHVLDSSLGYYFNPLLSAAIGLALFREKLTRAQLAAYGLALVGVILATVDAGRLPLVALILPLSFAVYGAVKKKAQVDPAVSVTVETLLCSPFCLLYLATLGRGSGGFPLIDGPAQVLLLIGAGLITALPLVLFSQGVNALPLSVVGFVQFLSPTLALLCGLALGETMSRLRWLCMLCIWAAVLLFSVSAARRDRAAAPPPSDEGGGAQPAD
ncbi:MAG: EamA family transporter RarD [Firmicutes bacterium]|nr:EamA family transporter RarD [Bacillota bacterium]